MQAKPLATFSIFEKIQWHLPSFSCALYLWRAFDFFSTTSVSCFQHLKAGMPILYCFFLHLSHLDFLLMILVVLVFWVVCLAQRPEVFQAQLFLLHVLSGDFCPQFLMSDVSAVDESVRSVSLGMFSFLYEALGECWLDTTHVHSPKDVRVLLSQWRTKGDNNDNSKNCFHKTTILSWWTKGERIIHVKQERWDKETFMTEERSVASPIPSP